MQQDHKPQRSAIPRPGHESARETEMARDQKYNFPNTSFAQHQNHAHMRNYSICCRKAFLSRSFRTARNVLCLGTASEASIYTPLFTRWEKENTLKHTREADELLRIGKITPDIFDDQ